MEREGNKKSLSQAPRVPASPHVPGWGPGPTAAVQSKGVTPVVEEERRLGRGAGGKECAPDGTDCC